MEIGIQRPKRCGVVLVTTALGDHRDAGMHQRRQAVRVRLGSRGSSRRSARRSISAVWSSASRRSRNPASPVSVPVRDSTRADPLHCSRKSSSVSPLAQFLLFESAS
jgi:hypothetical protein